MPPDTTHNTDRQVHSCLQQAERHLLVALQMLADYDKLPAVVPDLDPESAKLEQEHPGILKRLETEPTSRIARDFDVSKTSLFRAQERIHRSKVACSKPDTKRTRKDLEQCLATLRSVAHIRK